MGGAVSPMSETLQAVIPAWVTGSKFIVMVRVATYSGQIRRLPTAASAAMIAILRHREGSRCQPSFLDPDRKPLASRCSSTRAIHHSENLRISVFLLDRTGVDCLELAVPFPNSISDGATIRRSAVRALQRGTTLDDVAGFVRRVRPKLRRLRIALLADWSYTVRPLGLGKFLGAALDSGADGLLIHGLPPQIREVYYETADRLKLRVVTTCYATSITQVLAEAARHASAYLYLVARYGRTGISPADGYERLEPLIHTLRGWRDVPVAVGFGVKTRAHLDALRNIGADAAIIGSAFVGCLEPLLIEGSSPLASVEAFL